MGSVIPDVSALDEGTQKWVITSFAVQFACDLFSFFGFGILAIVMCYQKSEMRRKRLLVFIAAYNSIVQLGWIYFNITGND